MMGGSSSSSNTTKNDVTNYSLQGIESDGTVIAGNNNTVTATDHGAVKGALDFAKDQSKQAFGFGDNALELADKVVDSNKDVTKKALDTNENVSKYAIDKNSDLAGRTVDFADNAIENGFDFSKTLVDQNTANSANTTLAIKDLAKSLATGGASDVANQSTKMVYTMGAVFAVVVLGFVIMLGSRKR
ncbi:hypothetical protein [Marinomonas spartinae]|uniref:hypothetical protein n=1 Tax=Marinomonas spartinae TaxID=1792290 RepID=UPI0018F1F72B|nr:hypothetical protein [Marinomonas spartinae]MBJ7556560.1 hypothetical protein [Marinomonas spartinae]